MAAPTKTAPPAPAATPAKTPAAIADSVTLSEPIGSVAPDGLEPQVTVLVAGRGVAYLVVHPPERPFCWLPPPFLKANFKGLTFTIEEKLAIIRRARQLASELRTHLLTEASELAALERQAV